MEFDDEFKDYRADKRQKEIEKLAGEKVCVKCLLIECCCEADRLQVIKDDKDTIKKGYKKKMIQGEIRFIKK